MSNLGVSPSEQARTRLRATLAQLPRAVSAVAPAEPGGARPSDGLHASLADLVSQLDLGPEPELRECPHCQHRVMKAATLCSTCWAHLTPPAA